MTPSSLTDWELWACASATLQQHREHAPFFVAERIGALVLAGDMAGVDAWKQIAARIDKIQRPGAPLEAGRAVATLRS